MAAGVLFSGVLTHAPGRLLFAATAKRFATVFPRKIALTTDSRYGGIYRLSGTVAVASTPDVPVSRRLRLFHRKSACCLAREIWSNADGSYVFARIERGPWVVVAFDHTGEYNAVIADNVFGELI